MDKHGSSAITPADTTFISITLVRALAIAGIIIENYHNTLSWNEVGSLPDTFTSLVATVGGTLVNMFFIISGYGLTLSCLRNGTPSWAAWAAERFRKIVVPYWVAVIVVFAAANLSHLWAPVGWQASYSGVTLLAYLAFLRNVYEPAQTLNPSFWFMPVIIGLYALFPLLLQVMKRYGPVVLMALALIVGNSSVAVCVYLGYPVSHQGALPLYFVDEFALGMALAAVVLRDPGQLNRLGGLGAFFAGLVFYTAGGFMARYKWLGAGFGTYNDIFTAAGLYLMLLPVCRRVSEAASPGLLKLFDSVSRNAYLMYLVHAPIILYILKPYVGAFFMTSVGALPMIFLTGLYAFLVFTLVEGVQLAGRNVMAVMHH